MEFNFNEVNVENARNQYLAPGNYVVKTTEVKSGLSAQKQSPYIEITVADATGATASNQYYLNTEKKEGSDKSAFDISGPALIKLVAAANNLDIYAGTDAEKDITKNKAKALLGSITSPEALATKLSTLLVGKQVALHLDGKYVNPTDTSKKSWVKAEFGGGNFVTIPSKLNTLNPNTKIKGTALNTGTDSAVTTGVVASAPSAW